ncbi:hypothetical protein HFP15_03685 [Amycolatopsis sp. K13G38]|uniref:Lipoprotein n=1 Tax=Amycolatopsis acididurans TaxID=2724524 RepID=A0ABX1J0W1_9PSEU|nr:hypothetical protein [Amycolatopsis acididurans]NKQ51980.1 hypothetical protein [Amycolatopsis acididurans]
MMVLTNCRSLARRLMVAIPLGALSLVAGCGSAPQPTTLSSVNLSAAPSQAPAPPVQDERAAVEAAYTQFWPRSSQAPHKPEDTWQGTMALIAVDPQLSITLEAMHRNRAAGLTTYGEVVVRISSVEVAGNTATVVDCQDASRAGQADAGTGDPKTVGVSRMPVTAAMKRDPVSGQWKVAQLNFPGGAC